MSSFPDKTKLPEPGLGLGLRRYLWRETLDYIQQHPDQDLIQWLEIVPENYIALGGLKAQQLEEILATNIPLIPHGVNLSIGTAPEKPGTPCYDPYLIQELHKLFDRIQPPWFSDHLSCTRISGYYLQDLIPLAFTQETINIVSDNVKFLQDEFQLPFLVENPSFYSTLIDKEMSEAEFINAIMQQADCGMLLDVNNIFVNASNHDCYKPEDFLDQLNLDRVVQVHIAGHLEGFTSRRGKYLKTLDTHGETIRTEVYDILAQLLKRTSINAILLERDSNFPEFDNLIYELKEIRKIMDKYSPVSA